MDTLLAKGPMKFRIEGKEGPVKLDVFSCRTIQLTRGTEQITLTEKGARALLEILERKGYGF